MGGGPGGRGAGRIAVGKEAPSPGPREETARSVGASVLRTGHFLPDRQIVSGWTHRESPDLTMFFRARQKRTSENISMSHKQCKSNSLKTSHVSGMR